MAANLDDGPKIQAVESAVPEPLLLTLGVTGGLVILALAVTSCLCLGRRRLRFCYNKPGVDKPLTLSRRRPTAVRSPAGSQPPTHYLRKTPSPGAVNAGSGTPSPTAGALTPQQSPVTPAAAGSGTGGGEAYASSNCPAQYRTESEVAARDKPAAPSKEESETNEKNTTSVTNDPHKLGQLVFKLRYKADKAALVVSVSRCRDLPAKDLSVGSSDPYVKLQLLPDKQHKVKTRVLRKTRNPVYDEDFTFYGMSANQLAGVTLHFVVLSFDRYSRDDIIGEVLCSLASLDIAKAETGPITVTRDIHPRSLKIRTQGRGELLLSLCWQPAAYRLTVVALKARNLPKMDVTGLADPYVKIYLLYNGQRIAKKKTHVKKRTLNPVFNESFVFDIPSGADGLDNVSLEFLLLDWDRVTKNEVIGRLELGSSKSTGSALHHWTEVCNSPRRQIAEWHKLRE